MTVKDFTSGVGVNWITDNETLYETVKLQQERELQLSEDSSVIYCKGKKKPYTGVAKKEVLENKVVYPNEKGRIKLC